jgi:UDP-2,3-diacylglucosamine pyrophosphatase LpxH
MIDDWFSRSFRSLARLADRVDVGRAPPGPVAGTWAAVKLLGLSGTLPATFLVYGAVAAHNTRLVDRLLPNYAELLARVLANELPEGVAVERRDGAGRFVITSDLHRCHAGHSDWPARQGSDRVYEAMLDHYADGDWTLVENGDVEDLWLAGGSTYGVVYELARLAAVALPERQRTAVLTEVYEEHLRRVVANNRPIYDRIAEFAQRDAYVRIVGNHDDVWRRSYGRRALADQLGQSVVDHLVLTGPDAPVALVTHGHQTDAWNGPGRDRIGKLFASWGSALHDLPVLPTAPGMPPPSATVALLGGRAPNQLLAMLPLIGADLDAQSLDEVKLCQALRDTPVGRVWLVLGHTHVPLKRPTDATAPPNASPARYINSGAGILHRAVTAIEWDGSRSGEHGEPSLGLVAWHDDGDVVRRTELEPDPADPTVLHAGPAATVR